MTGNELIYLKDGDYVVCVGENGDTPEGYYMHNGDIYEVEYQTSDKKHVYVRSNDGKVLVFGVKSMLQNFNKYDADELGLPDTWQMKQEQEQPQPHPQLKDGEIIVTKRYMETLFMITADMAAKVAAETNMPRTEMQDLFEAWAEKFEAKYRDTDWNEGSTDYWEAVEKFEDDEYFAYRAKDFVWTTGAVINLQYIQNANACPENEFVVNPQSDRNRRLAMEFTMYERDNHIDYDDPKQDCWESVITTWLSEHK